MAQENGGGMPPLGGRSAPKQKRAREESGDVGDADEVRGHCPALTTKENRDAAISMLPDPDPTKAHSCDGCGKDVKGFCYIRCAECIDPRAVDVCIDCFRKGSEPFNHLKTHAYRVMDRLQTPIYTDDWTAAEELSLADHTRTQGLGAWEDLSFTEHFFRRKSPSELKTRYLDTYLCRYGSVLPPDHLTRRNEGTMERVPIPLTDPESCQPSLRGVKVSSLEIQKRTMAELGTNPVHRYEPSWHAVAKKEEDAKVAAAVNATVAEGTATAGAVTAGTATAVASTATPAAATAASGFGSKAAVGSGSVIGGGGDGGGMKGGLGEGGAEGTAWATATAAERDAEEAAAAKDSQNSRKRLKREEVIKNKEEERKIKAWVGTLPGAGLHGYHPLRGEFDHEHDNSAEVLLADMVFGPTDGPREKQAKLDTIGVYNHRLDEREKRRQFVVEHNLLDSKKQPAVASSNIPKEDRKLRARLRPLKRFSTADEHNDLVDNLLVCKKLRTKLAALEAQRQNVVSTTAVGLKFELNKKKVQEQEGGGGAAGLGHRGRANLMDVTGATGVEFLSKSEIQLCSRLHMLPKYYLGVKTALLQEYVRAGFLKKKDLPNLSVMDIGRLNQIYDFCVACGWVRDQPNNGGNRSSSSSSSYI